MYAKGKDQIWRAFEAISAYFHGKLKVREGKIEVIDCGDTALVIMETWLDIVDEKGLGDIGPATRNLGIPTECVE